MPLDNDVDLDALASSTPGMAGADLASLATEAALLAARRNHNKVTMADFTDSLEKILLGTSRLRDRKPSGSSTRRSSTWSTPPTSRSASC